MLRAGALAVGGCLAAAIALAAADIPTRYVGAFPSLTLVTNITGVFTGSALTLKGTFIAGTLMAPVTGQFACTRASSTQTSCRGRFFSDNQLYAQRERITLTVTWSAGRPVAMTH